jgi:hypothetical protein
MVLALRRAYPLILVAFSLPVRWAYTQTLYERNPLPGWQRDDRYLPSEDYRTYIPVRGFRRRWKKAMEQDPEKAGDPRFLAACCLWEAGIHQGDNPGELSALLKEVEPGKKYSITERFECYTISLVTSYGHPYPYRLVVVTQPFEESPVKPEHFGAGFFGAYYDAPLGPMKDAAKYGTTLFFGMGGPTDHFSLRYMVEYTAWHIAPADTSLQTGMETLSMGADFIEPLGRVAGHPGYVFAGPRLDLWQPRNSARSWGVSRAGLRAGAGIRFESAFWEVRYQLMPGDMGMLAGPGKPSRNWSMIEIGVGFMPRFSDWWTRPFR